jgi:hypothetical protein
MAAAICVLNRNARLANVIGVEFKDSAARNVAKDGMSRPT